MESANSEPVEETKEPQIEFALTEQTASNPDPLANTNNTKLKEATEKLSAD